MKADEPQGRPLLKTTELPGGHTLYVIQGELGADHRRYVSDAVGGGVTVWDPALVVFHELTAAIFEEMLVVDEDTFHTYWYALNKTAARAMTERVLSRSASSPTQMG